MDLYLVRHADALEADRGMTDAERPVSEEGRAKMEKGARGLRNLLSAESRRLDAVLSSPTRRALETAAVLAEEVLPGRAVAECSPLGGPLRWEDLVPHLEGCPPEGGVALVGHEPALGRLAGWLICRRGEAAVPLKKGSIICFELRGPLADPEVELRWLLTSKQLRLLR